MAYFILTAGEYTVGSLDVLRLADSTGCSAYDAEFIVLAQELGIHLVTMDSMILKTFPETAISLDRLT